MLQSDFLFFNFNQREQKNFSKFYWNNVHKWMKKSQKWVYVGYVCQKKQVVYS